MQPPYPAPPRPSLSALLGLALCAVVSTAQGGVIRHDRDPALYTDLANQPEYDAVGRLTITGLGSCSGSLIASRWVLTAAHCVDSSSISGASFQVAGSTYAASNWFAHEAWSGDYFAGNDIGLIELATPVTGVSFANLYTGSDEFFRVGTYVGYGATGTGDVGNPGGGGNKIAGQNILDISIAGSNPLILVSDFDNPDDPSDSYGGTDPVPLDLEYLLAPGDSGGGLFIDVAGTTYLAGINSAVYWVDSPPGDPPDYDYGDLSGATRVSGFIDWIEAAIHPVSAINTLLLMAPGLLLVRRRRRA